MRLELCIVLRGMGNEVSETKLKDTVIGRDVIIDPVGATERFSSADHHLPRSCSADPDSS